MTWLKNCNLLSKSNIISDRAKAIQIFRTNTQLSDKKGDCENCKFISESGKTCKNKDVEYCNIFTNSLFIPKDNLIDERDISAYNFEPYKEISNDIKVFVSGDFLLYYNFKLNTLTLYEVDDDGTKNTIIKKAKILNSHSFDILMSAFNFTIEPF